MVILIFWRMQFIILEDSINVVSDWVQESEIGYYASLAGVIVREDAMNIAYKFKNGRGCYRYPNCQSD